MALPRIGLGSPPTLTREQGKKEEVVVWCLARDSSLVHRDVSPLEGTSLLVRHTRTRRTPLSSTTQAWKASFSLWHILQSPTKGSSHKRTTEGKNLYLPNSEPHGIIARKLEPADELFGNAPRKWVRCFSYTHPCCPLMDGWIIVIIGTRSRTVTLGTRRACLPSAL